MTCLILQSIPIIGMRWPIFLLGGIKIKYVGTVIPLNPKMDWGPMTINEC